MITVPFDLAVPVLQGRGLTLDSARAKLVEAQTRGMSIAIIGMKIIPVTFTGSKFTIGKPS